MDYGELLSRTWDLIWEHKFLILLGILVVLGSGGGSGSLWGGGRSLRQFGEEWRLPTPPEWRWSPGPSGREFGLPVVPTLLVLALLGIALIVAAALWVVSTLARGALIAGASAVDAGSMTHFGEAFAIAWRKGWTLLGIGVFPAIPVLALLLVSLAGMAVYVSAPAVVGGPGQIPGPRSAWAVLAALSCVTLPFVFVLDLLRTFANRACVLEGCGVFPAYGRGFKLLVDNVGSALLLFLLQVVIGIALGLTLLLEALCCVLWPLLILVQGTAMAYFSTMWTLAWRRWTRTAPAEDEALAA
jgi:hypothetical protein